MPPTKTKVNKPPEANPWSWISDTREEDVDEPHVFSAYRISGFQPCVEGRINCKRNPYCLWGLGEKKWNHQEKSGDDNNEGDPFRAEGKYAGLENLGATCYVNSLLQIWFHNPIFRPTILKWIPAKSRIEGPEYKPGCPLARLQAIFARLKASKRSTIDPSDFVKTLNIDTTEQQDAQEFAKLYMSVITQLLTDYKDLEIRDSINQCFGGQLQYETECQGCKNKTQRPEGFTELNLNVKKTLNESLDELLSDEIISNEYMCSSCGQKTTAERRMQLLQLPPVLNLQLLRFVYDREAQRRKKVTQSIGFPETLDLEQRMHKANPSASYKYHLTAVLIHNGQSTSSGHYLAQIKDLRSGEWLKFNDEYVEPVEKGADDQDKKSRQKKSKDSPIFSSAGASMLVYTLEQYATTPEPDPELHQYLTEMVRQEDETFETERNKNKTEKDIERTQRIKEVEWLYEFGKTTPKSESQTGEPKRKIPRLENVDGDSERMEMCDEPVVGNGPCDSTITALEPKSNGTSGEIAEFPCRKKSYTADECDFISAEWVAKWLDKLNPVPPIDNKDLLCEHKKLAHPLPNSVPCPYRIIPTPLANVLYEHYEGGPRLRSQDLCKVCVQSQCRKLRQLAQLDEDSKQVSELSRRCDAETSVYLKMGQEIPEELRSNKCWVGKDSFRRWKKMAKRRIDGPPPLPSEKDTNKDAEAEGSSEGEENLTFNAELFCEHGNLHPNHTTRKIIPIEAWTIIEKYFQDSSIMLSATESSCSNCRIEESTKAETVGRHKEIASKQKAALQDLYHNRNRPDTSKVGELYVVSNAFVTNWKQFVRDPTRYDMVEDLNNRSLICEHQLFHYPATFITEFLKGFADETDEMYVACFVTPNEWRFIKDNFQCDLEIKVRVVGVTNKVDDVIYEPDICSECAEAWVTKVYRKQFEYKDAPMYIVKREKGETVESEEEPEIVKETPVVSGKREAKPFNRDGWMKGFAHHSNSNNGDSVRRSQRPRSVKGEKTYRVNSTMTIKALKAKICPDFKALLSDQHLFFNGSELSDLSKSLGDYDIPARSKLYLEIDTASNGSVEEPVSTVETGFQGTLLLQGGLNATFGDIRSAVQNS